MPAPAEGAEGESQSPFPQNSAASATVMLPATNGSNNGTVGVTFSADANASPTHRKSHRLSFSEMVFRPPDGSRHPVRYGTVAGRVLCKPKQKANCSGCDPSGRH